MENLSDTHDPSHRVPGIYYWNADPPKKRNIFKNLGGESFIIRRPTLDRIGCFAAKHFFASLQSSQPILSFAFAGCRFKSWEQRQWHEPNTSTPSQHGNCQALPKSAHLLKRSIAYITKRSRRTNLVSHFIVPTLVALQLLSWKHHSTLPTQRIPCWFPNLPMVSVSKLTLSGSQCWAEILLPECVPAMLPYPISL